MGNPHPHRLHDQHHHCHCHYHQYHSMDSFNEKYGNTDFGTLVEIAATLSSQTEPETAGPILKATAKARHQQLRRQQLRRQQLRCSRN